MQIAAKTVVAIHYRVATADGELVDQSEGGDPLTYLHGVGQIVPGLESALVGKAVGDKVNATVSPEQGYGVADPELDMAVPLDAFPADARKKLAPGFRFMAEHPTKAGEETMFTVHKIENGQALVSGNHPLAGQTLCFQVEIVSVRAATAEESAHGHAHGPGGHHHH
jgi:FKBP-type peptidyl-prolyl cis-trans isomerase SlyD